MKPRRRGLKRRAAIIEGAEDIMKQPVRIVSVRYSCDCKPLRAPDEALDAYASRVQRVAEAPCVRHLSSTQRERVAIHAFDVDVPDADGAP
ncbi:hypothetical protein WT25_07970 [Burkholderia territorii]|nr:hypothetical protein WT25_07970 [Burkholderia territorii]